MELPISANKNKGHPVKWISDKLEIVFHYDTEFDWTGEKLSVVGGYFFWEWLINLSSLSLHTGKVLEGGIFPQLFKGNEGDSWVYSQHC